MLIMDGQVSISPKRLDKPVIIIGAGPVGLALAQGLKRVSIFLAIQRTATD